MGCSDRRAIDSTRRRGGIALVCRVLAVAGVAAVCGASLLAGGDGRPPPPLDVALDGSAPHETVQEAVDAAKPGAVIRIGKGTFDGPVRIDKPLTLVGAGPDETTLVADVSMAPGERHTGAEQEAAIRPTLKVDTPGDVVVRDLALTGRSPWFFGEIRNDAVVLVVRADARLVHVAVWNCGANGVIAGTSARLALDHCLVGAIGSEGVLVRGGERLTVSDSDLRDCGHACIAWIRGEEDVVERCRISGCPWAGVYAGGKATIRGNVFFRNGHAGLETGQTAMRSAVLVEDNLFLEQKLEGMSCESSNLDRIRHNTFVDNGRCGVLVLGSATPTLERNLFVGNPTAVLGASTGGREGEDFRGPLDLRGNWFWRSDRVATVPDSPEGDGERELPWDLLLSSGNRRGDPGFADPAQGDYALPTASAAAQAGVGVPRPLPTKSPWPIRPEEEAWRKRLRAHGK